MKWQEVLKGSLDPDFLSITVPGVVESKKHLVIKIPEGKRIDVSKLRTLMPSRPINTTTIIQDLPAMMRMDLVVLFQARDIGKLQGLVAIGAALESGMIMMDTIQGPMIYNSFATLWLATPDEEIPELFKKNCTMTEIPSDEDVFE